MQNTSIYTRKKQMDPEYTPRSIGQVGIEMAIIGTLLVIIIVFVSLIWSRGEYPNMSEPSFWPMIGVSFVSGALLHAIFEYSRGNYAYCKMYMGQMGAKK